MQRSKWLYLFPLILFVNVIIYQSNDSVLLLTTATQTPVVESEATAEATTFIPDCLVNAEATAIPDETAEATISPEVTQEATAIPEETAEATEFSLEPLAFLDFEPYDLSFNPNPEAPFAVIMNFTLFFHNVSGQTLEVRRPLFHLEIEGIDWTELASTDFAMGRVQIDATQGIALQSLLILRNADEAQLAVLECVRLGYPVDLALTGTIETYPNDVLQTLNVEMLVEDVVIAGEQD